MSTKTPIQIQAITALEAWHNLIRKLKTDYDHNSLDVIDQIEATKNLSWKALESLKKS